MLFFKKKPEKPQADRHPLMVELSDINNQATFTGGVKSSLRNTANGAAVISRGAQELKQMSLKALQPGRTETFEEAMARMQTPEADLPLIHNQIALQVYITLAFACASFLMMMVFVFARGAVVASLLCFVIGVTCLAYAMQSSVRAMQVRQRKLGLRAQWLEQPGQWLPRRIEGLRTIDKHDPLCDPVVVEGIVKTSRSLFFKAKLFFGAGLFIQCLFYFGLLRFGWTAGMLLYCAAFAFLMNAFHQSFEVFRRTRLLECDLMLWVMTPSAWVPSVNGELAKRIASRKARLAKRLEAGKAALPAAGDAQGVAHGS